MTLAFQDRTAPRKATAMSIAAELGLSYERKGDKTLSEAFRYLPERPRSSTVKHVLRGDLDGRPLVVFETSHMAMIGQVPMQIAHTVYAVDAPDWPPTHVTPRIWIDRVMRRLFRRRRGLELENDDFNMRWRIRTDDEDFAIAILTPEMQTLLLEKTTVRWRIEAGRICLVYTGALKPARVAASIDRQRRFWSLVPPELESW